MFPRLITPGPEQAVLVQRWGQRTVSLRPVRVLGPFVRAELVDLGPRVVEVERVGPRAVCCADWSPLDVRARLHLRVERSEAVIERLSRILGADGAILDEWITPWVEAALGAVAGTETPESLRRDLQGWAARTIERLREDLAGFVVEDLEITLLDPVANVHRGPFR